jgi:hypothetical protein
MIPHMNNNKYLISAHPRIQNEHGWVSNSEMSNFCPDQGRPGEICSAFHWAGTKVCGPRKAGQEGVRLYAAAGNPRRTPSRAKRAIYGWTLTTFLVAAVLITLGCSQLSKGYGKTRMLPREKGQMKIDELIDNWEDYEIYYSAVLSRPPLGIIFDPKNNDTTLQADRWRKISDQKFLVEAVKRLYFTTDNQPTVRILLGPDDQFFGYMYHAHGSIVLRMIDDKTMFVHDLQSSSAEDQRYIQ